MLLDVLQLDAGLDAAVVGGGARPLEGDEELVLAPQGRPPELHVAQGRVAAGTPVLERDRGDAAVHEDRAGLSYEKRAELAPGMPEVEIRVPRVGVDAEEVELELRPDLAPARRNPPVDAETSRSHARPEVAVFAELVRKRRQFRRALDVEPIRVDLVEVVNGVRLRVPVDFHPRTRRLGDRGRGALLALRRHLDLDVRGRRSGGTQSEVGHGPRAVSDGDAAREPGREMRDFRRDVVRARRQRADVVRARRVRDRRLPKARRQIPGGDRGPGHDGTRPVDDAPFDRSAVRLSGRASREQQQNPHRNHPPERSSSRFHIGSFRR